MNTQTVLTQVVNRCIAQGSPVIVGRPVVTSEDIIALEEKVLLLEHAAREFQKQTRNGAVSSNRDYAGTLRVNLGSLVSRLNKVRDVLAEQYKLA